MKTNLHTRTLISELQKAGKTTPLWKRVAEELESSTRRMVAVNLSKIDKVVKAGEIALVPGKVLSTGSLSKKISIAAFSYSEAAREKIAKNGETLSLSELLKKNPQGKKVRLVK
ncbi:MAG: large subunit ribosomal protein L18e [archaeon GW2011_AR17]|nr:MAG: large subunit ribosomal protein L18e [archaeon GW2011_AR17]MBS3153850.1 50S ribosomal protein L18e [Candidatus Woesearchaeota archaeon]HIH15451.1 50S ribosomal protein L18e [Nanoarchaeota archaeon]HIH59254.1 50S ribosomal protein L18e [Nanoarchaeota archaeon]HII13951.1 50S ribosomal protein L18e [Nanoarchaeota archaeon]